MDIVCIWSNALFGWAAALQGTSFLPPPGFPLGEPNARYMRSGSQDVMSLVKRITWLSVHYTACTSTFLCLSGVVQGCPCETIIRPSRGQFLVLSSRPRCQTHTHIHVHTQTHTPSGAGRVRQMPNLPGISFEMFDCSSLACKIIGWWFVSVSALAAGLRVKMQILCAILYNNYTFSAVWIRAPV